MTQSNITRPDPAIAPCPPWCQRDHERFKRIHESNVGYIGDDAVNFAAYASRDGDGDQVCLFGASSAVNGMSAMLTFREAEDAERFATLLELLAGEDAATHRMLAEQVRWAVRAIAGEAS